MASESGNQIIQKTKVIKLRWKGIVGCDPIISCEMKTFETRIAQKHTFVFFQKKGPILVARHGDPKKPVLITYHDIGLNYLSNFQVSVFSKFFFNSRKNI